MTSNPHNFIIFKLLNIMEFYNCGSSKFHDAFEVYPNFWIVSSLPGASVRKALNKRRAHNDAVYLSWRKRVVDVDWLGWVTNFSVVSLELDRLIPNHFHLFF